MKFLECSLNREFSVFLLLLLSPPQAGSSRYLHSTSIAHINIINGHFLVTMLFVLSAAFRMPDHLLLLDPLPSPDFMTPPLPCFSLAAALFFSICLLILPHLPNLCMLEGSQGSSHVSVCLSVCLSVSLSLSPSLSLLFHQFTA